MLNCSSSHPAGGAGKSFQLEIQVRNRLWTLCSWVCGSTRRWTCSWPRGHDTMTRPTNTGSPCRSSLACKTRRSSSSISRQVRHCWFVRGVGARVTFTNSVEGKVAKSEETLAPGCWWTTCSATSSCTNEEWVSATVSRESPQNDSSQEVLFLLFLSYLKPAQSFAEGL